MFTNFPEEYLCRSRTLGLKTLNPIRLCHYDYNELELYYTHVCSVETETEALCDFQYCSDETRLFANFDILNREKV